MYMPTSEERTAAMLCHIGAVVGSFVPPANLIVPVVIWMLKRDQSAFVNEHGKEAINFQISLSLALTALGLLTAVLVFLLIGLLLIPVIIILAIVGLVLGVVAGLKAYEGQMYRYPYILRLLK